MAAPKDTHEETDEIKETDFVITSLLLSTIHHPIIFITYLLEGGAFGRKFVRFV